MAETAGILCIATVGGGGGCKRAQGTGNGNRCRAAMSRCRHVRCNWHNNGFVRQPRVSDMQHNSKSAHVRHKNVPHKKWDGNEATKRRATAANGHCVAEMAERTVRRGGIGSEGSGGSQHSDASVGGEVCGAASSCPHTPIPPVGAAMPRRWRRDGGHRHVKRGGWGVRHGALASRGGREGRRGGRGTLPHTVFPPQTHTKTTGGRNTPDSGGGGSGGVRTNGTAKSRNAELHSLAAGRFTAPVCSSDANPSLLSRWRGHTQ